MGIEVKQWRHPPRFYVIAYPEATRLLKLVTKIRVVEAVNDYELAFILKNDKAIVSWRILGIHDTKAKANDQVREMFEAEEARNR